MKLRIYFRPALAVLLLLAAALLFSLAALKIPLLLLPAGFYWALSALGLWALWRISRLERWASWDEPRRLLIFAPHEDDCAIAAGGIGARNHRLGGVTHIVYLAPDETPGLPEVRAAEARDAWTAIGVDSSDLRHIALLPPLHERSPAKLRTAAIELRGIIDAFRPDTIVVPMFEGGHVHHDMLAALLGRIVTAADRFTVFEAPEYSPYVSLAYTPHRIVALCARWLFGLVAYYGPPDGIDGRPVEKIRLSAEDMQAKARMLASFVSQNAPALVAARAYPDRLVPMDLAREWKQPYAFRHSYLSLALAARRVLPARLVQALLPGPTGTIGRDGTLTNWQDEWSERPAP
ncbi:MAG: PIG-L family deacetylase [Proteobacteria bacterium]|nr:PIG-L family deacetylase [Pseudomonadota bacterium]